MPGKRVVRIGVFSCATVTYCSFYVEQLPESGKLIKQYWCNVKPEKYERIARVLNDAASRREGYIEAHTALPGFVWERGEQDG